MDKQLLNKLVAEVSNKVPWADWEQNAEVSLEEFGELLVAAIDAERGKDAVAWAYTINNSHSVFSAEKPPEDAYDEGTLFPLYATPQPPAPCQKCAESKQEAFEEGRRTDNMRQELKERGRKIDALQSKVAELEKEVQKSLDQELITLTRSVAKNGTIHQQAARLQELEEKIAFRRTLVEDQQTRIAELEAFKEKAFLAHPNLDLDIEALNQKGN